MSPTYQDVQRVAESISARRSMLEESLRLRDQYFNEKLGKLPEDVRLRFAATRKQYFELKTDENTKGHPELKRWYNRAAKRFHPDVVGTPDKAFLFRAAVTGYENKDTSMLQTLVLVDMATCIDTLTEKDRQFLMEEYNTMGQVQGTIWNDGAKAAINAAGIYTMSDSMFRLEIDDAIRYMDNEIARTGLNEAMRRPPLLEGR